MPGLTGAGASTDQSAILRAAFVMERHLGHRTFSENLRAVVDARDDVRARWIDVDYAESGRWWERAPGLGAAGRGALRGRREVRNGLGKSHRDVVFFNTQVPAVLAGRSPLRGPYVLCTDVTPRQYDLMAGSYGHATDTAGPVATMKHRRNLSVMRGAARLVAWSNWVAESLETDYGLSRSLIDVIPPGVDVKRWAPRGKPVRERVRLLFVGGDFHRKGGEALLRVFRSLPTAEVELVIVTRTRLNGDQNVRVLRGVQPNSPRLLEVFASSDIFVMPSAGETFGIAAVEASAAGLPVVGTRVGGLPDIVDHGRTGLLVAPGDDHMLRLSIETLVKDITLRERMGMAARIRAEAMFDAEYNTRRILDALRSAASLATAATPMAPRDEAPAEAVINEQGLPRQVSDPSPNSRAVGPSNPAGGVRAPTGPMNFGPFC